MGKYLYFKSNNPNWSWKISLEVFAAVKELTDRDKIELIKIPYSEYKLLRYLGCVIRTKEDIGKYWFRAYIN